MPSAVVNVNFFMASKESSRHARTQAAQFKVTNRTLKWQFVKKKIILSWMFFTFGGHFFMHCSVIVSCESIYFFFLMWTRIPLEMCPFHGRWAHSYAFILLFVNEIFKGNWQGRNFSASAAKSTKWMLWINNWRYLEVKMRKKNKHFLLHNEIEFLLDAFKRMSKMSSIWEAKHAQWMKLAAKLSFHLIFCKVVSGPGRS